MRKILKIKLEISEFKCTDLEYRQKAKQLDIDLWEV